MQQNLMFLLVLWFLLTISVVGLVFLFFKSVRTRALKRRRWARIRVPNEKMIVCRISEPKELAGEKEFIVNDINVGGMAFFCDRPIEKTVLKLLVRFPFTQFSESSAVWGKTVYCNEFGDSGKYRIGISYVRQKKRSK